MRKFQQGASASGILLGVILFCLVLKIGVSLLPPFFDDRVINNQIAELVAISNNQSNAQKFNTELSKRLDMNNIRDPEMTPEKIIKNVVQTGTGLQVTKSYEYRTQFLLNIDFVIKFEKKFDKNSAQ